MSTTSPVGSGTSTNSTSSDSSNALSASGLNITPADFLKLITAQMQAQNPLQPSDPTQFLTQLEQMSQVSSMQSMQTSLTNLQTSLQSSQMANGAALIGQTVLAPATTATVDAVGDSITGAVSVPSGGTMVTVNITSANGTLVNTLQLTPATSGLTNFTWNGTNAAGTAVPAGTYSISATASDGTTNATLTPLVASKVQSVTVDSSTSALDVTTENGTVPLSSVVALQ